MAKEKRRQVLEAMLERGLMTPPEAAEVGYGTIEAHNKVMRDQLQGLLNEGFLVERSSSSHAGRRLLGFATKPGHLIAVVVTSTRVRAAFLDLNLIPVAETEVLTDALVTEKARLNPEEALNELVERIAQALYELALLWEPDGPTLGSCIALPLAIDERSGVISDSWGHGFNVHARLADRLNLARAPKIELDQTLWTTDVAAASVGYLRADRSIHQGSVLGIKVSAWVRHVLIIDGEIVRGARNRGHALGRIPVRPDGHPSLPLLSAAPGERALQPSIGVLDDHASLIGMQAHERLHRGKARSSTGGHLRSFTENLFTNRDQELHRALLDHAADKLGEAISVALHLVDPDAVLMTGHTVRELGHGFASRVRERSGLKERRFIWQVDDRLRDRLPSSTLAGAGAIAVGPLLQDTAWKSEFLSQFDKAPGRAANQPGTRKKSADVAQAQSESDPSDDAGIDSARDA